MQKQLPLQMRNKGENGLLTRSFAIEARQVNEEKREVTLSFSSETEEVERWFGIEILDHSPKAVRLDRIQNFGALILNHDADKIIGPIKEARVENGRGLAVAGIDETEEGELAMKRMKSKSLRGTSVRYNPLRMKELLPGEEYKLATKTVVGRRDIPVYIVTEWEPVEISATPIPADTSIGIGRELSRSLDGIEIERNESKKEEKEMEEKDVKKIFEDALREALPGVIVTIRSAIAEDSRPKLRITAEEGSELLGRAGAISPEVKGATADMIMAGKTREEVTKFLFEEFTKKKPDARDAGGLPGDGTGLPEGGPQPKQVRSMKDVADEDFFGAIVNPSGFVM